MAKKSTSNNKSDFSFIKIWAEKFNRSVDEIQQRIQELINKIKQTHPDADDSIILQYAKKRAYLEYTTKYTLFSKLIILPIYISGPIDFGLKMYNEYKKIAQENLENALKRNIVKIENGQIIPIDNREYITDTMKNPNYLKPLPMHNYLIIIGGIYIDFDNYKSKQWDNIKLFESIITGNQSDEKSNEYILNKIKLNIWYSINGTIKTKNNNAEQSNNIDNIIIYDIISEINDINITFEQLEFLYSNYFIDNINKQALANYYNLYYSTSQLKAKPRLVVFEGIVASILDLPRFKSIKLLLEPDIFEDEIINSENNQENTIQAWIKREQISFGKGSKLLFFGKLTQAKNNNIYINIIGTFPIFIISPDIKIDIEENNINKPIIQLDTKENNQIQNKIEQPKKAFDVNEFDNLISELGESEFEIVDDEEIEKK